MTEIRRSVCTRPNESTRGRGTEASSAEVIAGPGYGPKSDVGEKEDANAVAENARQEADQIRERAHQDSESIIAEAREQASRLVAQDQITIAAKSQATRVLDEAQSKADALKRGADGYAASTLDTLSDELNSLLDQIEAGRAHLAITTEEHDS